MFLNDKIIVSFTNTNAPIEGKIESFSENRLSFFSDVNNSINLTIGQGVDIYISNNFKGELKYTGIIDEINQNRIIIKQMEKINVLQRREEVRVEVLIPIKINQIYSIDKMVTIEKYIYGNIIDLSASGFLLNSKLKLPHEMRFLLNIPIGQKEIKVIAEIIRKEEDDNIFNYGCHYTTADKEDEEILRQYVLRKQIESKRKFVNRVL